MAYVRQGVCVEHHEVRQRSEAIELRVVRRRLLGDRLSVNALGSFVGTDIGKPRHGNWDSGASRAIAGDLTPRRSWSVQILLMRRIDFLKQLVPTRIVDKTQVSQVPRRGSKACPHARCDVRYSLKGFQRDIES